MKKILLPLLVVCCLAPAAAFAGHPLATDAAETVEPKKYEAETAMEFITDKGGDEGKKNAFVVLETISAGVIPHLDAFITVPFASYKVEGLERESGLNDVVIGMKYNFVHIDNTAFAIKPFIVLPTGDDKKGLGEGAAGFGAVAVISMELDKHISVDGNVSFKRQGVKDGEDYNLYGASLAGKYEATKELKVVGEVTFSKPDTTDAKWATYLTAGAQYAVQKNIDVDCGLRFGLTKDTTEDFGFLVGVTLKF